MIGHVGTDPEVRYVEQGVAVARFRFATTEKGYTLQNGTQVPDRTDWHNVILWRRLAEIVERYVHKGDRLYIEGRLRYSTYDNKQGQRQYVTEIWADNMEMLRYSTYDNKQGQRQYVTEIWADNMEMLSAKPTGQQEQPATASQTTATDTTSESSQSDALPF